MKRLPDVMCFIGLAMIGAGLWIVYPPLMLVVIGTLMVCAGVWSHITSTRVKQEQPK